MKKQSESREKEW